MKKVVAATLLAVSVLVSCVTTGHNIEDFFFLHGAILEEGPMGFILTSSNANALALRPVGPYSEKLVCEFSLQAFEEDGTRNGFLVLVDRGDPGGTIVAGVYIGAGEYAIEGTGVREPIVVPIDFDASGVFNFSVLVNFEKGFVEMKTNEREIGTGLAPRMKQVDVVGYHANSTTTHFSEIVTRGR